ncbi:MAG: hypothetical protein AB7D38_10105 [Sulfurimonas sp.]|uniref:acylneuraminate cytidylyltransferase family protein n=1 Tax=Sulfurimonas sp. TaxID=2022749 RepID=UPI003D0C9293
MNIALVPARCGSKSIKLKNIKLLGGKPLIYWVLKALNDSEIIDNIFVATDCKKIADTVISLNLKKVSIYNRLAENARDESSTESLLLEFLTAIKPDKEDNIFLVQATSPMLQSSDITKAYNHYIQTQSDSLLTCTRTKRFFWNEDATPINYDFKNRPRRQDFAGTLVENGALYINKVSNIIKFKNRLSGKIAIYEMPEYSAVDIDEEDDWIIAQKLMKKYILME